MAKSKYHISIKGMQNGRKRKFNNNGGSPKWKKNRRRIRQKLLR